MVSASPPPSAKEIISENGVRREAKWWYSTFHIVTAMFCPGVLSLPYAMAYLGWGPGTLVMILLWCVTLNTMWQLIQLHESVPGVRFDRYIELGRHAFGPKLGAWMVLPQQLIVQLFHHSLGWLFESRAFNALGQIAFAYAGHAVVLEIQATVPSTPEKPSKVSMWKGAVLAYFINAICYFPVAFIGYWTFGHYVTDNLLVELERPAWLIAAANLMVVVHVLGSYQVFAMPVFDMLETTMVQDLNFPPGVLLRLIVRSAYVAITLFIGVTFPFFGDLIGFFGGFGFAPISFFLPSAIWLKLKKPKIFSISWLINWACIVIGVFIMFASTIGGLRNIVADSSTYKFYS